MFNYYRNPTGRRSHRYHPRSSNRGWGRASGTRGRSRLSLARSRPRSQTRSRGGWRRNSAPVWGGPLYRRNLIPLARRQELQAKSPGNFRRPTLASTQGFLDDWKEHGVSNLDEMRAGGNDAWSVAGTFADRASAWGSTPEIEHAKAVNRYEEAEFYHAPYREARNLYDSDPDSYYKPKFTQPKGGLEAAIADDRDFGDYEPIDKDQARNYLYQFLHRNAQKRADGESIDDVREDPFKFRYRDAVLTAGPDVASKLARSTFSSFGKRAPRNYLPENLYDDLGDLFPAAEEAASSRRFRKLRRRNPHCNYCGSTHGAWCPLKPAPRRSMRRHNPW